MSSSFKGYLPATTFVMAKRGIRTAQSQPTQPATTGRHVVPVELIFVELSPSLADTKNSLSSDLLSKMIDAMTIERAKVWITHHAEYLDSLPDFSNKMIVALGEDAAQQILNSKLSLSEHRKKVHTLDAGNRVIATFHPRYLLENPQSKKEAWEDLKMAMRELGLNAR